VSARDGEVAGRTLTHVSADGDARMVDVSSKPATERVARATGAIRMRAATLAAIRDDTLAKGDVLTVAKVAGIMAAKRTSSLVPLCHPIALSDVQIVLSLDDSLPGVRVEATTRTIAPTGVEMEAITAVSLCLVTLYDMAKSVDREMVISDVMLVEKTGGRSGRWVR
jgi:cyclic pyranopterin phosphate synthase